MVQGRFFFYTEICCLAKRKIAPLKSLALISGAKWICCCIFLGLANRAKNLAEYTALCQSYSHAILSSSCINWRGRKRELSHFMPPPKESSFLCKGHNGYIRNLFLFFFLEPFECNVRARSILPASKTPFQFSSFLLRARGVSPKPAQRWRPFALKS